MGMCEAVKPAGMSDRRWKRSDITDEQVIRACVGAHANPFGGRSLDILMETTGAPEKVCWAAMERAADRRLIDYGVSLATAWVSS